MPKGSDAGALSGTYGRIRPVISGVRPLVDDGAFPAKGSIGEDVVVSANIFADGPDAIAAEVRFKHEQESHWLSAPLRPLGNDRWSGAFPVDALGTYRFRIRAVIDDFTTWQNAFRLRASTGHALAVDLLVGREIVQAAAERATGADRKQLSEVAAALADGASAAEGGEMPDVAGLVNGVELKALMGRHLAAASAATSRTFDVEVERSRARFSSWYELFPRSTSPDPSRSGTLADLAARLAYVADLGFDVVYLPPIHPIGTTARKGPDGINQAAPGDPGSPWAIGADSGGHTSIHPALGTLVEFKRLVVAAKSNDLEIALDLALQCSPDHPWVHDHPEWFKHLPDGTIQTAENPPKRYEDVYPLDFSTPDWRHLWEALLGVTEFWIAHGVRIFRVDNPHTKPLRFWEWLIASVRADHPDVIMLAEAFTRPRIMEHLAKIGFSQSYTYFTWRNTPHELRDYLHELTHGEMADYFRPNLWPNTPDILHEFLQHGGRPAFSIRLVLAATLAASYGIYGPPFEFAINTPRTAGSEEYLHSEKFEVHHWDSDAADTATTSTLSGLIKKVNALRRDHPALQQNRSLHFHGSNNDRVLVYSKTLPASPMLTPDATPRATAHADVILVVITLDPVTPQESTVHLDLVELGIDPTRPYRAHDLLTDVRYVWRGADNYVRLDPSLQPAHIFGLEQDTIEGR